MSYDVVAAEYERDYKIRVTFENGKTGTIDLLPRIEKGGIYGPLKNERRFRDFEINSELGVLTWGEQIDIAPETLYSEAVGEPLPEWMTATDHD